MRSSRKKTRAPATKTGIANVVLIAEPGCWQAAVKLLLHQGLPLLWRATLYESMDDFEDEDAKERSTIFL